MSLSLVPDTRLLNPMESVGNRNLLCSKEASLGRPLDRIRMGTGHQKDGDIVRGLKHSTPLPYSDLQGGERPEIELITMTNDAISP